MKILFFLKIKFNAIGANPTNTSQESLIPESIIIKKPNAKATNPIICSKGLSLSKFIIEQNIIKEVMMAKILL